VCVCADVYARLAGVPYPELDAEVAVPAGAGFPLVVAESLGDVYEAAAAQGDVADTLAATGLGVRAHSGAREAAPMQRQRCTIDVAPSL
jgi:hypothetical protein